MLIRAKGSFTLEAAVISAITMFIIAAAILMAFNMHDRVIMLSDPAGAVLKNVPEKDEKDVTKIKSAAEGSIMSDQIRSSGISVDASFKDGAYLIRTSAGFDWVMAPVREYVSEDAGSIYTEVKVSNLNGRKKLLLYKQIKELTDLSGTSEK